MSLTKPKNAIKSAVSAALLAVLLANLSLPLLVKADSGSDEENFANIVPKVAFYDLSQDAKQMKIAVDKRKPKAKPHKLVNAVITAYTSSVEETDSDPFTAASGKKVYDGMIAANWLPFGTKIKIPSLYGDKIFTVHDRMNSRYGYGRMDIWLDATRAEARKFGVKRVVVEVYYSEKKLAENK